MRSEAEIRKQVEARLKRWLFLIIDGGAWLGAAFILWQTASYRSFGQFSGALALFMLLWLVRRRAALPADDLRRTARLLGARAVERERRYYVMSSDEARC